MKIDNTPKHMTKRLVRAEESNQSVILLPEIKTLWTHMMKRMKLSLYLTRVNIHKLKLKRMEINKIISTKIKQLQQTNKTKMLNHLQ
jgi:ABC-type siderophore export system fused ATPase/permease subunit